MDDQNLAELLYNTFCAALWPGQPVPAWNSLSASLEAELTDLAGRARKLIGETVQYPDFKRSW